MFLHPCHDPFECFFLPILLGKDFDQNQSFLRGANHHEPQQHHHICWYNWNFPFLVKSTGWRFPKICWVLCHISVVNKSNFYWPTLAHSVAFDTIHIYPVILLARPWKLHQTGFYPQISNHPIFVNSPFNHFSQGTGPKDSMHRTPDLRCALQRSSVAQAAQAMGMDGDVGGFLEETEDSWRYGWRHRLGIQKSSWNERHSRQGRFLGS